MDFVLAANTGRINERRAVERDVGLYGGSGSLSLFLIEERDEEDWESGGELRCSDGPDGGDGK